GQPADNGRAVLLPQHLADLQDSGLSDGQIAACGFYTESDPKAVSAILGWKFPAKKLGSCLVIPYFDAVGNRLDEYQRLKTPPARTHAGKTVKYESPGGQPNRAYFPPRTRAVLQDVNVPLLITEGEKKAAKADQEGFACIGMVGVWGWQTKRLKGPDGK